LIRASLADAERVNEWVRRDFAEAVDFTPFLSDRKNVFLMEGNGGAAFLHRAPGFYEVHVCFEQRGREVIDLSHRMLDWMRENMGAERFMAAVPTDQGSRKVRLFTRLMGWTPQGFDELPHGRCEIFLGE
jgi:hypothetical protein